MNRSVCALLGVLFMLAAASARDAAAQAPQALPAEVLRATQPLTEQQLQTVEEYVSYWVDRLAPAAETDIAEMNRARDLLVQPLRSEPRPIFRTVYEQSLLRHLEPRMAKGDDRVAVNAIIIISALGSDSALRFLVDRLQDEDAKIRLRAAVGVSSTARLFRDQASPVSRDAVDAAAAAVAEAAGTETDPFALRRELEALEHIYQAYAAANQMVNPILDLQLEVLDERIERLAEAEGSSNEMRAIYGNLNVLWLEQYLRMPSTLRSARWPKFSTRLSEFLKTAEHHWEAAQKDPEAKRVYSQVIDVCEKTLQTIDRMLRSESPDTRLRDAWERGDRDTYGRDVRRWEDVMSLPPYRG
jgi:hypothetical protein